MIFQHTAQKVLQKKKWQTRRRVKSGERLRVTESYTVLVSSNGYRKYRTGKDYAVQPGRGQKQVGRVLITDIRQEDVRLISDEDVRAEGFDSRDEFLSLWEAMHGNNYHAWVYEFELVEATE